MSHEHVSNLISTLESHLVGHPDLQASVSNILGGLNASDLSRFVDVRALVNLMLANVETLFPDADARNAATSILKVAAFLLNLFPAPAPSASANGPMN